MERTFRNFLNLQNFQDWAALSSLLSHPTITLNGSETSPASFITRLRDEQGLMIGSNLRIDAVTEDESTHRLAARVIVQTALRGKYRGAEPTARRFEFAKHLFCRFEGGKIAFIQEIVDGDGLRAQARSPDELPNVPRPKSPFRGTEDPDFLEFYKAYIDCINSKTMAASLHQYCQPTITWNGRRLPLDEYKGLMEETFDAIPDLIFRPTEIIADQEQGIIAVRIEFEGTPVKTYSGAQPNGRQVAFAEHAMYWLVEGKISAVLTVIDWDTYRRQLRTDE
jgi:predicted ester cyclase